jgi:hypothetical protein
VGNLKNRLKSISKVQVIAIVLILIGLVITVRYSMRTLSSYREIRYARENNFDAGNPDLDLIRPWMSVRYIAVAYTVPQEFIFAELGIPIDGRTAEASLLDLNDRFDFGRTRQDDRPYPLIIDRVREAITEYRQNPVPTGLKQGGVRPWMSVQYIANTTGIPADRIFEQIGIPFDDNAYIPLDVLSDRVRYEGGPRALVDTIQRLVDRSVEESQ